MGILPDPASSGAVVYRDALGNALNPPDVSNAYAPPSIFVASCPLTALPNNCEARIEPRQINAIVSELISLAECFDSNGPWSCTSVINLCTAFNVWEAGYTQYVETKQSRSEKGQPNGYASLDANGKVPAIQLPSYVDDVLEFADLASFPATGMTGIIYVALDTGKTYRWSGSAYIEVSPSEVNSVNGYTGIVVLTKADVGLGNVDNTSDLNKPISTATQTALNGKLNLTGGTLTGNLWMGYTNPFIGLTKTAATGENAIIAGLAPGGRRWDITLGDSVTEDASNNGSNFSLACRTNAGAFIGYALYGTRSTGLLTVIGDPTVALGIATKQYADGKVAKTGDTMTGALQINGAGGNSEFYLYKAPGANVARIHGHVTPNLPRWQVRFCDTDAETGSNAGTSFSIIRFDDAGTQIAGNPLVISRATGHITIVGDPVNANHIANKNYVDGKYRERLTAARTYYVRTDGNDANTGLVNNAGGAFRNISKGIAVAQGLDLSIYDVTIQVAGGTYTEAVIVDKKWTGQGKVILSGDTTTPANVTWNVSAGHNLSVDNSGDLSVKGFKFINTAANGCQISVANSTVTITGNCEFGAATASGSHFFITAGGYITSNVAYSITGNANNHINCRGGKISTYGAKTVSGTLTFGNGFVLCNYGGWIDDAGGYTGGTVTATRYSVASNSIINTYGAGANYYPGNVAGVASTGGIYA